MVVSERPHETVGNGPRRSAHGRDLPGRRRVCHRLQTHADDLGEGIPTGAADDGAADKAEVPESEEGKPAETTEALQPWDKVSQRIRHLQMEKAELKAKAKAAAKAMKAALRAKRRTARNAKKLSDEELVQIVMERKVQAEVAKQVAAEAASAAARASGSASAPPPKTARKQKASGHEK